MLRLSIIVPVYNVEKYLAKCLESLLFQDLLRSDYEILIINDGSTDQCLIIASRFAEKNPLIKIISQPNRGSGTARNTGINNAKGEYMLFVDADDFIKENCLGGMLEMAEKNSLDVFYGNYEKVDRNYSVVPKRKNAKAADYRETVVSGKEFLVSQFGYSCYVGLFLFRTAFILEEKIFFGSRIYFEDMEWLPRILVAAKRVLAKDLVFYYYLRRPGSIMNAGNDRKNNDILADWLTVISGLQEISDNFARERTSRWFKGMIALSVMGILDFTENFLPDKKAEIISHLKNRKFIPLSNHRFSLKQLIAVFLINIHPLIYCRLKRNKGGFD